MEVKSNALTKTLAQFTYKDMHDLCIAMNIGVDELYLRGKWSYSRLLITRMCIADQLSTLVLNARTIRPDFDWKQVSQSLPADCDSTIDTKQ